MLKKRPLKVCFFWLRFINNVHSYWHLIYMLLKLVNAWNSWRLITECQSNYMPLRATKHHACGFINIRTTGSSWQVVCLKFFGAINRNISKRNLSHLISRKLAICCHTLPYKYVTYLKSYWSKKKSLPTQIFFFFNKLKDSYHLIDAISAKKNQNICKETVQLFF